VPVKRARPRRKIARARTCLAGLQSLYKRFNTDLLSRVGMSGDLP
jgi:hypothetical protein